MTEQVYGITIPADLEWEISFQEWIKEWNACTTIPLAAGLLHSIFDANEGEGSIRNYKDHRILFLLRLADGYGASTGPSDIGPVHRQIRYKAFQVLSTHVFKNKSYDSIRLLTPEVRKALQDFFSHNVPWTVSATPGVSTYNEKVASEYMQDFCRIAWGEPHSSIESRLWALDLLHGSDELFSILPKRYNERDWALFNEPILARLEEMALRGAPSVEEAVYKHSQAATLLTIVRAAHAGQVRERRKKELETQAASAAAGLAELS